MTASTVRFIGLVLRGYGQFFFANRVMSGVLILVGLFLLSPGNACWSMVGASVVTAVAWRLGGATADLDSGLFGVNGALLGYSWIYFPEIPEAAKGTLTILGSAVLALVLVPCLRFLRMRRSSIPVFALPYVLAVWVCLTLANGLGLYDAHLLRGWVVLFADQPAAAQTAIRGGSRRHRARGCLSAGWVGLGRVSFRTLHRGQGVFSVGAVRVQAEPLGRPGRCGLVLFSLGAGRRGEDAVSSGCCRRSLAGGFLERVGLAELLRGEAEAAEQCFGRSSSRHPSFKTPIPA